MKSVTDAIYGRRAVRDYRAEKVDSATIKRLLDAAVHAPTAMHEEPWSFVVIQDKETLNTLSEDAKKLIQREANADPHSARHLRRFASEIDFNIFYNASTLVVICSTIQGQFVVADCWLAAENLMLAAYGEGLGTCVIGLSVPILNTPEWKSLLKMSADAIAVAPIIVGIPAGETVPTPRKAPEILSWK